MKFYAPSRLVIEIDHLDLDEMCEENASKCNTNVFEDITKVDLSTRNDPCPDVGKYFNGKFC